MVSKVFPILDKHVEICCKENFEDFYSDIALRLLVVRLPAELNYVNKIVSQQRKFLRFFKVS